jgi:hypothetical protein
MPNNQPDNIAIRKVSELEKLSDQKSILIAISACILNVSARKFWQFLQNLRSEDLDYPQITNHAA